MDKLIPPEPKETTTQPSQKIWIVRQTVLVTYVVRTDTRREALNVTSSGHLQPRKTVVTKQTCYQHIDKPPKYRKKE